MYAVTAEAVRTAWMNAMVTPILAVPAAPLDEGRESRPSAQRHRGDPG
jgi:hypothetical protein